MRARAATARAPHPRAAATAAAAAAAAVALATAAVLAIATPASAHNVVTGTTPADGATITELPELYSVTTSEPMLELGGDAGFAMQVTDAAGRFYGNGCLAVDGGTMSLGATAGEAGEYTVTWQIVSEDGHPSSGAFAFTWEPASDATITPGLATPPVCGETVVPPPATPTETPQPAPSASHTASTGHGTESGPVEPPLGLVLSLGVGVLLAGVAVAVALLVSARRRKNAGAADGTPPPAE